MKSNEKPSKRWKPMRKEPVEPDTPRLGYETKIEQWANDRYYATVRRFDKGPFGVTAFVVVGISRLDECAIRDWRDLQFAKNDICGEEWEAVELFPAESRKLDPSNRYYLQCFPPGVLQEQGVGIDNERHVIGPQESIAPQRAFHAGNVQ